MEKQEMLEKYEVPAVNVLQWKNENVILINTSDAGRSAELKGVGNDAECHIAVYPYSEGMKMDIGEAAEEGFLIVSSDGKFQVPETQVLTPSPSSGGGYINTFAKGANISVSFTDSPELSFRSACPIAKVTVQKDDVAKITISADEQICGEVLIWVNYDPSSPERGQFIPITYKNPSANKVSVLPDENYGGTFKQGDICYAISSFHIRTQ